MECIHCQGVSHASDSQLQALCRRQAALIDELSNRPPAALVEKLERTIAELNQRIAKQNLVIQGLQKR